MWDFILKYYLLSDTKKLTTMNKIRVSTTWRCFDLCARNLEHVKTSLCDDDDDDDDDDDADGELSLWYGWPTKGVYPYFQPGSLSEILTITNLRHAASRVWICAEPEFRLEVENEVLSSEWSCAVVITTTPRRHITTTLRWHVKEDTTWRHVDTRRERVKTPYKLKGKMQFKKHNIFNLKHFWKSLHLGGF